MAARRSSSGVALAEDEEASLRPPKLPRTQQEKETARRLIVVLEGACLETVKVCAVSQRAPSLGIPSARQYVYVCVSVCVCMCVCVCVAQVGKGFQLLNSTDHANMLKKHNRDTLNVRPDITHQVPRARLRCSGTAHVPIPALS
jgi:rRNA small subunit pseudouridine methyltransferase Nep1